MLSEQGSQTITFNCRNTIIDISNYDIKLHTKNGMIYQMYLFNDDSLRYNIIKDECKVIFIIIISRFFLYDFFFICSIIIMVKQFYRL